MKLSTNPSEDQIQHGFEAWGRRDEEIARLSEKAKARLLYIQEVRVWIKSGRFPEVGHIVRVGYHPDDHNVTLAVEDKYERIVCYQIVPIAEFLEWQN